LNRTNNGSGENPSSSEDSLSDSLPLREARDNILDAFERQYLSDLLASCQGNVSEAARLAGVDRKTITRMLKRHGLR